jgi:hypothetical protein
MRRLAPLLAVLVLTGCGASSTTVERGSTLHVRINEFRLRPQKISVKGPKITLVLTDDGRLTHNLKVFSDTQFDETGKPILLGGTPTAHPGETVSGSIRLSRGRYRLACTIANHDDLGEHGILIVR